MSAYELGRMFAYYGYKRLVFRHATELQQPFDCGFCDEMECFS